jgi:hypothetical protein
VPLEAECEAIDDAAFTSLNITSADDPSGSYQIVYGANIFASFLQTPLLVNSSSPSPAPTHSPTRIPTSRPSPAPTSSPTLSHVFITFVVFTTSTCSGPSQIYSFQSNQCVATTKASNGANSTMFLYNAQTKILAEYFYSDLACSSVYVVNNLINLGSLALDTCTGGSIASLSSSYPSSLLKFGYNGVFIRLE